MTNHKTSDGSGECIYEAPYMVSVEALCRLRCWAMKSIHMNAPWQML